MMTSTFFAEQPTILLKAKPLRPHLTLLFAQNGRPACKALVVIFIGILYLLAVNSRLAAQAVPVEIMAGNKYVFYQHVVARALKPESRIGWQHITNLIMRYNTNPQKKGMPNEIMNQAYVTGRLSKSFKVLVGGHYTNATSFRPSAAIQLAKQHKDWFVILMPRVDLYYKGAADIMGLVEYRPSLTQNIKLYSRVQVMTNSGPYHHNRSYQRFRLGLDTRGVQFGLALELDEYGEETERWVNTGLFIRKEIF